MAFSLTFDLNDGLVSFPTLGVGLVSFLTFNLDVGLVSFLTFGLDVELVLAIDVEVAVEIVLCRASILY